MALLPLVVHQEKDGWQLIILRVAWRWTFTSSIFYRFGIMFSPLVNFVCVQFLSASIKVGLSTYLPHFYILVLGMAGNAFEENII